jgi:hypothetical protein
MAESKHMPKTEQEILRQFEGIKGRWRKKALPLPEVLNQRLAHRADIIFRQVKPYLKDMSGRLLDFGCGDGQVGQKFEDNLNFEEVHGVDVRDYRAPGVTIPISKFNGRRVNAKPGYYQAIYMGNVAHHEKYNERILKELARLKPEYLIVNETVPTGDTYEELEVDRERTFLNDVLYNRLFHNADVPVPGTYETPEDWVKRFAKHGFILIHSENLGVDQPTIRDTHHLLVFRRAA